MHWYTMMNTSRILKKALEEGKSRGQGSNHVFAAEGELEIKRRDDRLQRLALEGEVALYACKTRDDARKIDALEEAQQAHVRQIAALQAQLMALSKQPAASEALLQQQLAESEARQHAAMEEAKQALLQAELSLMQAAAEAEEQKQAREAAEHRCRQLLEDAEMAARHSADLEAERLRLAAAEQRLAEQLSGAAGREAALLTEQAEALRAAAAADRLRLVDEADQRLEEARREAKAAAEELQAALAEAEARVAAEAGRAAQLAAQLEVQAAEVGEARMTVKQLEARLHEDAKKHEDHTAEVHRKTSRMILSTMLAPGGAKDAEDAAAEPGPELQLQVQQLLTQLYSGKIGEEEAAQQLASLTQRAPSSPRAGLSGPASPSSAASAGSFAAAIAAFAGAATPSKAKASPAPPPPELADWAFRTRFVMDDPDKLMRLISRSAQIRHDPELPGAPAQRPEEELLSHAAADAETQRLLSLQQQQQQLAAQLPWPTARTEHAQPSVGPLGSSSSSGAAEAVAMPSASSGKQQQQQRCRQAEIQPGLACLEGSSAAVSTVSVASTKASKPVIKAVVRGSGGPAGAPSAGGGAKPDGNHLLDLLSNFAGYGAGAGIPPRKEPLDKKVAAAGQPHGLPGVDRSLIRDQDRETGMVDSFDGHGTSMAIQVSRTGK